ncbi:protein sprouty homolog 1 [Clupea harengus]|uniref:Protein sprouty homolog 1 n=1 Tax=Clupea harengus TaxID=7950 RepID=A0A6P3W723_CLUHA|nr:protein sprouty homolog 1 [Clupea harengus]
MELQRQHGSGGSLVVIQQPSLEGRLDRLDYERELQHAAILSLDQIKAIRSNNEYTEGPSVARRPVAPRMVVAPRPDKHESTHEIILVNVNNNYEHRHPGGHPGSALVGQHYNGRAPGLSRSTSTGSAASSGSNSSASSEQGLLVRSPPSRLGSAHHHNHHHSSSSSSHRADRPVRTQPKSLVSQQQQQQQQQLLLLQQLEAPLKPSVKGGLAGIAGDASSHQFICERCGKCKCTECTAPRTLPSCLVGQCLCSPDSVVEHGTCMCLAKGIFYHCSNDDEGDSCADHPCSLSRSHCCSRFLCMGLMSVLFPCLLCYPPVRGCVKACQDCHDRVNRPGCRCKNSNTVYCKLESWASQAQEKPS